MATLSVVRIGWFLLLLGVVAESLAWWAHALARGFAFGGFAVVNWLLIVAGWVPICLGVAILFKHNRLPAR